MNINPIFWPWVGRFAALAVIAAGVGGGIAFSLNPARETIANRASAARLWSSGLGGVPAGRPAHGQGPISAGEPGISTYLCPFKSEYVLLQWSTAGSALSGTYQDARLTGTAPGEQVSTSGDGFSGTVRGSGITLSLGRKSWYGTISSSAVTLNVPQPNATIQSVTCGQSDISGWNSAVRSLNARASSDNGTALQQQAQSSTASASASASAASQQEVQDAQQSLASDVSSLTSDSGTMNNDTSLAAVITTMQNDYGTEETDWQAEQSDSCSNMSSDASTVSGDANTVSDDLNSLSGAESALQTGDYQSVQTDLANVQNDLNTLSGLGATPDTPASAAIAEGNQALTNETNAVSWANGKGSGINSDAGQLAATAQDWASQNGC